MKTTIFLLFLFITATASSIAKEKNVLYTSIKNEMNSTIAGLKEMKLPPYFISYYLNETHTNGIRASFGKIRLNRTEKNRKLDIDLRVGDYDFDNTHIIRGNPFSFNTSISKIDIPIEDDEAAIRNAIWYATDRIYKSAIERYEKAITNQAVKVAEEDTSADFSREKPLRDLQNWKKMNVVHPAINDKYVVNIDTSYWAARARRLSAMFIPHKWLLDGTVSFSFEVNNKLIIHTEGTELQFSETSARCFISLRAKAEDGMTLPLFQSYFGFTPDELPSEEAMAQEIEQMIDLLYRLKNAPMAETYSGPAILSGEASGVFFHEIFGHRVEGHREKDPNASQTFKNSIGRKILPDFLNVIFDPTISRIDGKPVAGYYVYDDEGVRGQRVETVINGTFSNFLMSRIPIQNFTNSNGHGRKQIGYTAVSRQSNLIVESTQTVSNAELRNMLIEEVKKQNKDYGLFFDKVSGGFTFTSRTIPNAFNVTPIVVYKVFADGRPDELVRGVDLIGTPLTTFANVVATADDIGIFNGTCGAESGGVPVSAVSPSLLVSTIEVQKKKKSQAKPPILEAPDYEALSQ